MSSDTSSERLMDDLRAVIEDAETLLRATSGQAGDKVQQAREKAEESIRGARERLGALEGDLAQRASDAARDADRYVRDKPWQALAIAAGAAFVVGLIMGRR